ncbi:hypothetical protein [Chamaesiphon sp. VAR_48_metabat_403]|nr:hypothetical protein [Chamaesiphon sp. VAR_48_metabat_403]
MTCTDVNLRCGDRLWQYLTSGASQHDDRTSILIFPCLCTIRVH